MRRAQHFVGNATGDGYRDVVLVLWDPAPAADELFQKRRRIMLACIDDWRGGRVPAAGEDRGAVRIKDWIDAVRVPDPVASKHPVETWAVTPPFHKADHRGYF